MDDEKESGTGATVNKSTGRADEAKICAYCETKIDTTKWHPLATETDDDGSFSVYAFCDGDCRNEWADTDSDASGEKS